MGFLVTGSIETTSGTSLNSFYVRIEDYKINKPLGDIYVHLEHYTNSEAAAQAHPQYKEDYAKSDASGTLPLTFTYDSVAYNWRNGKLFPLTTPEDVTVTTYSGSFSNSEVEYIDFDDDGNEVTKTRNERVETITTGSAVVTKNKINLNLITGSVYEYAYKEVKDFYKTIFGASNVNDHN
tara:strand:- start:7077 stop:7616 length:540 start_codon:yes stop_codon:yes gene_type:complete